MKVLTVLLLCIAPMLSYSQIFDNAILSKAASLPYPDSIRVWTNKANVDANFSQQYFSNWQSGSLNSVGIDIHINDRLIYERPNFVWTNTLILQYGLSKQGEQEVRKTNDQLEWNAIVGKRINPQWSYSFVLNAETQIANGYNYDKDISKKHRTTGFLAPLYLTFGPGIFYRKGKLSVNLSPVAFKNVSINGRVHRWKESLNSFQSDEDVELLGIPANKKIVWQAGAYANILYDFNVAKNINASNILVLYSNYLQELENVNIDYTLNVNFTINPLLSTKLLFRLRYNDDSYKGFQIMQQLGVGFKFKI